MPRKGRGQDVRRRTKTITAALALLSASSLACAGTANDSFDVTATVLAACEVTAQDLVFGNYDPVAAANLDAQTTMSVTCTNGTGYQIGLNLGSGTGATTATRYMKKGSDLLGYTLYQNAGRTTLWGNTQNTDTRTGTGTGSAATVDVFARVPMHQTAPVGNYSDTITVTVTW